VVSYIKTISFNKDYIYLMFVFLNLLYFLLASFKKEYNTSILAFYGNVTIAVVLRVVSQTLAETS
jgi:hypothetical protein